MNKPWFDKDTGYLLLDEHVAEMPSFKRVMPDSVITDEEILEQGRLVVSLLQKLEATLSNEARSSVGEAICELTVLYALQRKRLAQAPLEQLRNL